MKKCLLLLLSFVIISPIFIGCKKDDEKGTLVCTNNSSDTYFVSVEGPTSTSFNLSGYSSKRISAKIGSYKVYFVQKTGYLIYPTEDVREAIVLTDRDTSVKFPN